MKLKSRIALVTGGSSGIGAAICRTLAREGAVVAVVASRELDKAAAVAGEIRAQGGEAMAFVADVRDCDAINNLVQDVNAKLGPVDILVNSAGVFYATPLDTTTESEFNMMVETNLRGTFFAVQAVAETMRNRGSGKVINIASSAAFVGSSDYGLYSAVKAGVVMLTKSQALKLAPFGINVNAVAPGNTETPINEAIRTQPEFQSRMEMIARTTPSQRKFSTPEDIANTVLFLVLEDSRAMHGATMIVDEGRTAGI